MRYVGEYVVTDQGMVIWMAGLRIEDEQMRECFRAVPLITFTIENFASMQTGTA